MKKRKFHEVSQEVYAEFTDDFNGELTLKLQQGWYHDDILVAFSTNGRYYISK
ncbi:MAG: hypothetical protein ACRDDZ_05910 [Marinifilaceae bacterium]